MKTKPSFRTTPLVFDIKKALQFVTLCQNSKINLMFNVFLISKRTTLRNDTIQLGLNYSVYNILHKSD